MPKTGQPQEVHTGFRFSVKIDGINHAAFTECTLPNLQIETKDLAEGGQNQYVHVLPGRVKTGSVVLRRGITRDGELLNWYLQVLNGEIANAMRTVQIIMYDSKGSQVSSWSFYRAYPVKWSGPKLNASEMAIAVEELELAHHGMEMG